MKKFNYTKWLIESKHGKPLNEELDANKIKDLLKNLIDNSEVDSDVRSDLVGIILPSLEKANAPEELVKNLKILSNDFDTKDGVPYSRQPDEVKNAITYLTGDKAQKSVDQIGDVAGGYADALKPGTEKIYTATTFPDGLRDSDFYKKSVKDGWKFITKNSLTPDQEKIAKSLPTKSDGTPLKERIQELSLDQKAKLYFMGLVRKGKIDRLPEDPKAAYIRDMMDKEDPKMDPAIRSDFDEPMFENLKEIASELGYLNEEVDITYSTPGDRFYKMKVDGKRLKREEGTKYLKGLGIDLEVPRKYETNKLDDIVKALEKKGIKADYNDAMDVS